MVSKALRFAGICCLLAVSAFAHEPTTTHTLAISDPDGSLSYTGMPTRLLEKRFAELETEKIPPEYYFEEDSGEEPDDTSRKLNVFGDDDRVTPGKWSTPTKSIGRVVITRADNRMTGCTGTLVSDNEVLTAAHCITKMNKEGKQVAPVEDLVGLRFFPHLYKGEVISQDIARVTEVVFPKGYQEEVRRAEDWALLTLDRPLGPFYGYLGIWNKSIHNHKVGDKFDLIAYSGDKYRSTPGAHFNCAIRELYSQLGYILDDCDSTPGSSGGGLIRTTGTGGERIVALHTAHYKCPPDELEEYQTLCSNIGIPTDKIYKVFIGDESIPEDELIRIVIPQLEEGFWDQRNNVALVVFGGIAGTAGTVVMACCLGFHLKEKCKKKSDEKVLEESRV
jgi:V8-like Glu-specific endopeptidase